MTSVAPVQTTVTASTAQTSTRRPGLCFACGKPGHWKRTAECSASGSSNKISTFVINETFSEKEANFP